VKENNGLITYIEACPFKRLKAQLARRFLPGGVAQDHAGVDLAIAEAKVGSIGAGRNVISLTLALGVCPFRIVLRERMRCA
jgi:hypothetical protein